jgi:hypothetical protein
VGEVACRDPPRGVADPLEREQTDADDHPRDGGDQEQHGAEHEALDPQQAAQVLVDLVQRHGDDRHVAVWRALGVDAIAHARARDRLEAADRRVPRQPRRHQRGGVEHALAEEARARHVPRRRAPHPVRAERQADSVVTRAVEGEPVPVRPALDGADRRARLLVGAGEEEGALLRVRDAGERHHARGHDDEQRGDETGTQRVHYVHRRPRTWESRVRGLGDSRVSPCRHAQHERGDPHAGRRRGRVPDPPRR